MIKIDLMLTPEEVKAIYVDIKHVLKNVTLSDEHRKARESIVSKILEISEITINGCINDECSMISDWLEKYGDPKIQQSKQTNGKNEQKNSH